MLLGIDEPVGTIEIGKVANLVVVRDNTLADVENLKFVVAVFKNGSQVR
jgi:imidazolonepropionase-like amidohydrolase